MEKILNTRACLLQGEIRAYLDNSLSENQRFDIENHLLDCPLCEAAVEGYAQADPSKVSDHLASIEQAIQAKPPVVEAADTSSAQIRRLPKYRNWIAAAAAILLLILSGIAFQKNGPLNNEQLFANNYQAYESPFSGARSGEDVETTLLKGLNAYQNKSYSEASTYFQEAMAAGDDQFIATFHYGLASLQLGKVQIAQDQLAAVRINSNVLYASASWYLALALLKDNQIDACEEVLNQIKPNEGNYYNQAQALLSQLIRAKE